MLGDILSGGFGASSRSGYHSSGPITSRRALVGRGAFKIAENESPRPVDRVFGFGNYYNDVNGFGASSGQVYRGVVGFEKTFMEGNASLGVRLPYLNSSRIANGDGFGDVSVILKYAFLNDCNTGNVASGGLVVTAPTGISPTLVDGSRVNSVLLQPWAGFIFNADQAYVHGFTSVVLPTNGSEPTLYTADLGLGYRLYQCQNNDSLLTSIIPTIEAHANIPLDHSNQASSLIYYPNTFVATAGVHLGLGNNCLFTLGAGVPLTGPRPYMAEYGGWLNIRF